MSLSSFPPTVPLPGTPFPPQGRSVSCPCFIGTMGCSDSRTFFQPRVGCPFATRYRRCSRRKRSDIPGFWGTFVLMPCSQTPVSPLRLTFEDDRRCGELLLPTVFTSTPQRPVGASIHIMVTVSPPRGARLLPSANANASALTMTKISGLNHTACSLAVYDYESGTTSTV
jgi:hypothetical protein